MLFFFFFPILLNLLFQRNRYWRVEKKNVERGQNFVDLPVSQFLASFFFTHVAHGDNRHTPRRRSNSEIGKSRSKFWLSKKKLYKQIRTAAAIVLAFSISAVVQFRCPQQLPWLPCMFGPFFSFSILFSIYTYIILYIQPYRASSLTTSVGRCRTTKSSGVGEK